MKVKSRISLIQKIPCTYGGELLNEERKIERQRDW